MHKIKLLFLLWLVSWIPLMARERVSGFCENGAVTVATLSATSTNQVQGSYPGCTITVYKTGTITLAAIYSDNSGTSLGNPFVGTNTGSWYFYADNGTYDVRFSGGGILTPFVKGAVTLWDSQGAGLYDIQQFGGVPDGTTDNTGAFNRAVAAATIGGTILVGPDSSNNGVYLVTSVVINRRVNIQCTSPGVVIKSLTPSSQDSNGTPTSAAITYSGVQGVSISGCIFDGNYSTTSGVYAVQVRNSTQVHLDKNTYQNLGGEGVSIVDSPYVWVTQSNFSNIGRRGVFVEYPDAPLGNFWFSDNVFNMVGVITHLGQGNIGTFGSGGSAGDPTLPSIFNVNVLHNKITNPGSVGIELDRCDYCIVDGNDVTGNATFGECIAFSGSYNHITNNKVHNSAAAGVGLYSVTTSDMSHNYIQNNIMWNNAQGIYMAFGPTDDPSTTSMITFETVTGNFAFNVAGGAITQGYGLQVYCDTQFPNPGNCVDYVGITYENNLITNNNFAFNTVGGAAIDAAGRNNTYTNNYDLITDVGQINMIQACLPQRTDVTRCQAGFPIPTLPITSAIQYPVIANGNTLSGLAMNAENVFVAGVGFNNASAVADGQLDLIASNTAGVIGFYTSAHLSNTSVTSVAASGTNTVLSVGSVLSDVTTGTFIYLFGFSTPCAYLMNQPQAVIGTGSGTITIGQGLTTTCAAGFVSGSYNTTIPSGRITYYGIEPMKFPFASLPTTGLDVMAYCTDCTVVTTPPNLCVGSGAGAFAFKNSTGGGWKCPF